MKKKVKNPNGGPHRFKKGESGNPAGSSAKGRVARAFNALMPDVAKRAPMLTPEALRLMIQGIMAGTIEDVKAAQKELGDKLCLSFSTWVTALQVAAKKGDVASLIKAAEFVHGRAPERYELSGPNGAPIDMRKADMTVAQMQAELAAIRARKKAQGID